MVLVLLPLLIAGPAFFMAVPISTIPLLFLVAGAFTLLGTRAVAGYLLLGAFPTALVGIVAALPRLSTGEPSSTLAVVIGVISFVAYAAGGALASGRPMMRRETVRRPLGSVAPIAEPRARHLLRGGLLTVAFAGSLAIAVVAPLASTMADYEAAWGEAAAEAFVLSAVVGATLAVVVLTLFVGPSLRASRGLRRSRRDVSRRVSTWLVLALFGGGLSAFYFLAR
jgi:hypothetical protein